MRSRSYRGIGAAAVAAVLVLLAGAGWLGHGDGGAATGHSGGEQPAALAGGGRSRAPASPPAALSDAITRCRATWADSRPALRAAARSLGQWQVHTDTMNQLVAGQIDLTQTAQFWDATRGDVFAGVARFGRADGAPGRGRGCVPPTESSGPVTGSRTLARCVTGAATRDDTLAAARAAMRGWRRHIEDMELLRSEQLTGDQLLQRWQAGWPRYGASLARYRQMAGTTPSMGAC